MSGDELESVLGSLEDRVETGELAREGGSETALVVSCSMCRRDHGGTLWPVDPSWHVVGVSTLGNQTSDGAATLDGDIGYLTAEYDVAAVVVVGHTSCEVIADAYDRRTAPATDPSAGLRARLRPLTALVETAFEEEVLDGSTPRRTARHRLVEYNVVRQVATLNEALSDPVTTVGYVYDQDGVYGSFPGEHYLVTLDGETDTAAIPARLPHDTSARVASIL